MPYDDDDAGDAAFATQRANDQTRPMSSRAGDATTQSMSEKDALEELRARRASQTPQTTSDDAEKAALDQLRQRRLPTDSTTPQQRVASAFGELPTSPVAMAPMEPGLREVGPSSEDLVGLLSLYYGGGPALKGLSAIAKTTPKVAKAVATGGLFEVGRRGMGAIFGDEHTSRLMDVIQKYVQHIGEAP